MQNYNSDGQMILFSLEADEIPERPPRHKSKTVSLSALISIPYFHLDLSNIQRSCGPVWIPLLGIPFPMAGGWPAAQYWSSPQRVGQM